MTKEILFSVTAADCEWSYARGTGNGGQARNRSNNAVHCHHRPSGAHGYSEASRSQADNRRDAFAKMANTPEFKDWHRREVLIRSGRAREIEEYVQRELRKVRIEIRRDGIWTEVKESELEN